MENRRKFLRFDVPLDLVFKPLREQISYSFGKIRNFSRDGFCFMAETLDVSAERVLEFKIEMPDGEAFINGLGEVIWIRKIGEENLVGIKLRDMHKESHWKILNYCFDQWVSEKQDVNDMCRQQ